VRMHLPLVRMVPVEVAQGVVSRLGQPARSGRVQQGVMAMCPCTTLWSRR